MYDTEEVLMIKTHQAALYTIINNLTQNSLRHGNETTDVLLMVNNNIQQNNGQITITNAPGQNHKKLLKLYDTALEKDVDFIHFLGKQCNEDSTVRSSVGLRTSKKNPPSCRGSAAGYT